jgi:hypothetical protein
MNNFPRYCLHCQIFNETRQEMKIDIGTAIKWRVPFTGRIDTQYMAVCPRCNSIEYFVERGEEPKERALQGLSSLFG